MKVLKKYNKIIYISISYILILPMFLSLLNLFNIKTNSLLIFIISIITFAAIGYITGKQATKKGAVKGLIISSILITFLFLLSLILKTFKIKSLIYYLILIITSTLFGSIGIGKK